MYLYKICICIWSKSFNDISCQSYHSRDVEQNCPAFEGEHHNDHVENYIGDTDDVGDDDVNDDDHVEHDDLHSLVICVVKDCWVWVSSCAMSLNITIVITINHHDHHHYHVIVRQI